MPAATSATDYPSLHTVPPRPRLTYTVEQRRAIVDGLIADRENARYTDDVVRYRTGRSSLPPPPAPPVVATAEPEVPAGPGGTAPDAAKTQPAPESDAGRIYRDNPTNSLGSFIDDLARGAAEDPPATAGSEAAGKAPAGGGWFGWLRQLFGQADPPAPQPSAPGKPASDPPASDRPASDPPRTAQGLAAQGPAAEPAAVLAAAPAAAAAGGAPPDADAALTALVAGTVTAVQPAMAAAPADTGDGAPAATTERVALAGRAGPAAGLPGDAAPAAGRLRTAADQYVQVGQAPAASGSADAPSPPQPGDVGIAIGDGGVAIEGGAPTAAGQPAAPTPAPGPIHTGPARVKTAAAGPSAAGRLVGRVAFAPESATLPAGIGPELEQVLAAARAQGARIRIVGEAGAGAGALALDRARAVALALVRLGAGAHELEMTLARHATGDQASLLLATAPR